MKTRIININQPETEGTSALQLSELYFQPKRLKTLGYSKTYTNYKLSRVDYVAFVGYLRLCNYSGFTGINNYSRVNETREFFYRWFLDTMIKKVSVPKYGNVIKLKLDLPEITTLKAFFNRVECPPNMISFHNKLLEISKPKNTSMALIAAIKIYMQVKAQDITITEQTKSKYKYSYLFNNILEYLKEKQQENIKVNMVDHQFIQGLGTWLRSRTHKPLASSYVTTHIGLVQKSITHARNGK